MSVGHAPDGFRPKPPRATGTVCAPGCAVPLGSDATCAGEPFATAPVDYDALVLLGFGGPEGQDDVIPFLRNVTAGRGIPDARLEEVAGHYRHFGGVSPINEHNRQLIAALRDELARRGIDLPVYGGNRNWPPYVSDALAAAHADGHRTLLTIATSAYSSYSSCRQYREDLADAVEATALTDVAIDKVSPFFDHAGFVQPFAEGVRAGLATLAERGVTDPAEIEILFSTHSIPTADADRSGPPGRFGEGGAYVAQHRAVAEVIVAGLDADLPWQLVYQSRSGPPQVPWLEPDINDALTELSARGRRGVLIVPLGFVSDHMEVLWDLDTEAFQTAGKLGLEAVRTPTPGVHPGYVAGLVDLVEERRAGAAPDNRPRETALGPWPDVCRPGCCENVRLGFQPALGGVAP